MVRDALRTFRCRLVVRRLPVGDYDLGDGVLVERKTLADLRASLAQNRLWKHASVAVLTQTPGVLGVLAKRIHESLH